MKYVSSYIDWDFVGVTDTNDENIWYMRHDGSTLVNPRFWWQHPERTDVNCDYKVNLKDFAVLSEEWQFNEYSQSTRLISDINDDDFVDLLDFSRMVEKWMLDVDKF